MMNSMKQTGLIATIGIVIYFLLGPTSGEQLIKAERAASGDSRIAEAFAQRQSDVQVQGSGLVVRVLPDDTKGSQHQRFILELATGQRVLVAHNIDLAPRIPGLKKGDQVAFFGEYEWNDKGGVVHWTHHDPGGRHVDGWLKHQQATYQ